MSIISNLIVLHKTTKEKLFRWNLGFKTLSMWQIINTVYSFTFVTEDSHHVIEGITYVRFLI
jgi:hypothetical protein